MTEDPSRKRRAAPRAERGVRPPVPGTKARAAVAAAGRGGAPPKGQKRAAAQVARSVARPPVQAKNPPGGKNPPSSRPNGAGVPAGKTANGAGPPNGRATNGTNGKPVNGAGRSNGKAAGGAAAVAGRPARGPGGKRPGRPGGPSGAPPKGRAGGAKRPPRLGPGGELAPVPKRKRSLLYRCRYLFYIALVMIMFATGGVMFAYNKIQIPADKPQEFTSFMCPATVAVTTPCTADNAIARLHGDTDRQFVKLADMPDTLKQAVIAAEDRGFFKHGGVSATGVMRALVQDIRGGATQGGSTITQQYVKNAYLTQERTITRKAKEAVLAVKLEQKLSKEEILERYLNTIYFGRGAYGVGAASRAYFAIPINQLSLAQAAYLAAVIRSPRGADPETKPEKATERRHSVLAAMLQEGYVTEPQRAEADAVPWVPGFTFVPYSTANNVEIQGSDFGSQYFVEYVRSQLEEKYNFSDEEIYGGGLQIYTTFDPGMQQKAYEAVQQNLGLPEDPWASLVAVDAEGQIKAMYGGADFKTNQVNTALGKDGGGTGQQPGSTMKPFVLAAALKAGISLDSRFPSPDEITIEEANDGADWPVRNSHAEKSVDEKNLDLREGIAQSSNTVFAQLELAMGAKKIGVDKRHADQAVSGAQQIAEAATAMGVTTGLPPEASLVLGTTEVSPLEMASAYSTLARGGTAIEPFAITKVVRPNKEEIILGGTPRPGAIPPEHAAQIVDTMQGVVREGTGKAANFGVPAAGKTGTTNNFVDAWFIGFVPTRLTAAVWMGHDGSQPMLNVHGVKEVVGGTLPAKIWKSFMQAVVEGTDVGTFPPVTEFPGEKLNGELRLPSDPPVTTVKEQPTTTTSPPTTTTTRPKPTLPTFTLPTRPPAEETTTTPRTFPTFPGGGGGGNGGPFGPFPDEEQDLVR